MSFFSSILHLLTLFLPLAEKIATVPDPQHCNKNKNNVLNMVIYKLLILSCGQDSLVGENETSSLSEVSYSEDVRRLLRSDEVMSPSLQVSDQLPVSFGILFPWDFNYQRYQKLEQ